MLANIVLYYNTIFTNLRQKMLEYIYYCVQFFFIKYIKLKNLICGEPAGVVFYLIEQ